MKWAEHHLYGSSRLGIWQWDTVVPATPPVVSGWWGNLEDSLLIGSRTYELTNHLGNVLATISDKKIDNDSSGVVNYYFAEVLSQSDYYPFGMGMPGREYVIGDNTYTQAPVSEETYGRAVKVSNLFLTLVKERFKVNSSEKNKKHLERLNKSTDMPVEDISKPYFEITD